MSQDYRVIEIIDNMSILINYGTNNGAKKGTKVRVIEVGEVVMDPKTGSVLGTYDAIKAELEITVVYEHFSKCQNISRDFISPFESPLARKYATTRAKTINVNEEESTNRKTPTSSSVSVGDIVEIL